jgi:hypothetical protein
MAALVSQDENWGKYSCCENISEESFVTVMENFDIYMSKGYFIII